MTRIQHFVETLIKDGYSMLELSHAFRINGFLDLYKGGKCVYHKLNNQYHKFTSEDNAILYVRETITGSRRTIESIDSPINTVLNVDNLLSGVYTICIP